MPPRQNAGDLRERIRAAGLRVTGPRVAVLTLINSNDEPVTHSEMVEQLAQHGLDRATVFRNLRDLSAANLVERVDLGDRVWRYQPSSGAAAHVHPHFVCTVCGEIECLDGVELVVSKPRSAPKALRDNQVAVHIKGRCDACATAA